MNEKSFAGRSLQNALLIGADFRDCDLSSTELTGALLKEADLSGAYVSRQMLDTARLQNTVCSFDIHYNKPSGVTDVDVHVILSTLGISEKEVEIPAEGDGFTLISWEILHPAEFDSVSMIRLCIAINNIENLDVILSRLNSVPLVVHTRTLTNMKAQ